MVRPENSERATSFASDLAMRLIILSSSVRSLVGWKVFSAPYDLRSPRLARLTLFEPRPRYRLRSQRNGRWSRIKYNLQRCL